MKWILLCEEYPIRMSLLVARVEDFKQKSEANRIIAEERKNPKMFKFLDETNNSCSKLDSALSLNEVYYEHVEPFLFTQSSAKRYLMQDADAEQFAILLATPIPEDVIDEMMLYRPDAQVPRGTIRNITVGDLTGEGDRFSLLDFALNLPPSHRDAIAMDNAQVITEYEPRRRIEQGKLQDCLEQDKFQRKDAYLNTAKPQPVSYRSLQIETYYDAGAPV